MHSDTLNKNKATRALRKHIRMLRNKLSAQQQQDAADSLYQLAKANPLFLRSHHIAFYQANDGEIDPMPLLRCATKMRKACYLPVVLPGYRLGFARYRPGDMLHLNHFNIAQPSNCRHLISYDQLDLVLVPLVAFDRKGGRIGMGSGFYDRSFCRIKQNRRSRRPTLVGLAHHFQACDQLTLEPWDIVLSAIMTDREIIMAN